MSISDYFHDEEGRLLVCLAGGLFFTILLSSFGVGTGELVLLWICYLGIAAGIFFLGFCKLQRWTAHLLCVFDELDQKYLFAEMIDKPASSLEKVYFRILKSSLKAMTDEVADSRRLNREYRDYIEQWIHEIKAPITGIQLLCENNKADLTRKIAAQTERIAQDVEKVLFYARLGTVEKDYFIREMSLRNCVMEVLARNKQFLIQNGVRVIAESIPDTVYSDDKWICFILNQIILNSIKYKSDRSPLLEIVSQKKENHIVLSVTDNGMGILPSEITRVFEKGFVGSNGRAGSNATGIGLYLCRQLCGRLGIDIGIESEHDHYTTVFLYFPKGN